MFGYSRLRKSRHLLELFGSRLFGLRRHLKLATLQDSGDRSPSWNALCDTRYAHTIPALEKLLHIFSSEWVGLRAAAGAFPGTKLALPAEAPVSQETLDRVARQILDLKPRRIVVQGMSDNLLALIERLGKLKLADHVYVVFQGAPAQWWSPAEARYASICFSLAQRGAIKGLHVLKPAFEFPTPRLYKPMLFNLSPKLVQPVEPPPPGGNGRVFVPGWAGWRKNIHTNALGAALSEKVTEVCAYAGDLTLPEPLSSKIRIVPYSSREQTFELIASSSLLLNVSLVDCHPMVHLEAQSLGRASIRGPLFLDALEDHQYIQLTTVRDVTSATEIKCVVDKLLVIPGAERLQLATDYQRLSDEISILRYREFLDL